MPSIPLYKLTVFGKRRMEDARGRLTWTVAQLKEETGLSYRKLSQMREFKPVGERLIQKVFQKMGIQDAQVGVDYQLDSSESSTLFPEQQEGVQVQPKFIEFTSAVINKSPIPFHVPYSRNGVFTGRETELTALHKNLTQTKTIAIGQTQAISGLGGIGKTQTAVEYAYRYRKEYAAVFWVNAETEQEIQYGFAEIARLLKLPEAEEKEQAVIIAASRRWLESQTHWLLILDNADTPDLLIPYLLPDPQGHVLITTRREQLDSLNIPTPFRLNTLSPQDSQNFLLTRCGRTETTDKEKQAAGELADELGNLPLALEQAAAYIVQKQATFTNYLALYRKRKLAQLEKNAPVVGAYPMTVGHTWDMNFAAIAEETQSTETARKYTPDLLKLCAFLAPDNIPFEIVVNGAKGYCPEFATLVEQTDDPAERLELYDEILEPLTRYSLIIKKPETNQFSLHRLVQAVQQNRLSEEEQKEWISRAIEAVNLVFPSGVYETWNACERLIEHGQVLVDWIKVADCRTETVAELWSRMGLLFTGRAQFALAEPLYKEALAIRRNFSTSNPLNVAWGVCNLGQLYSFQYLHHKASPLFEEGMAIRSQLLPKDHIDLTGSQGNLAHSYYIQDMYEKALSLHEMVLSIRRNSLPLGLHLAGTINGVATTYRALARYEKALPLYQEALDMLYKTLPADHPEIATILNNTGAMYTLQGSYDLALPLLEQGLSIRRKSFPVNHPIIAVSANWLGECYRLQGLYDEALPFYDEALTIRRASGLFYDIAQTLNSLGLFYKGQDKINEAEQFMVEALENIYKAFPKGHPLVNEYEANLEAIRQMIGEEKTR